MKKKIQKIVATILVTIMALGIVSVSAVAQIPEVPEEPAVYEVGDLIEYGTYPQTDVTASLGASLDLLGGTWRSYDYYSGSGTPDDGQMTSSDYMQYKDVIHDDVKYRGVKINAYRPDRTGGTSASNFQQSNGYVTGKVYWFKFEPIKWRILDVDNRIVMCDSVIDSQAYNNYLLANGIDAHNNTAYWGDSEKTYFANNYAQSSIRQWLNDSFYETAFSDEQKKNIEASDLVNKCYASLKDLNGYEIFDAPDTNDKIFLISYDYISKTEKQLSATAYAKCQGVHEYGGHSYWWLRTPYSISCDACIVNTNGDERSNSVDYANGGVCPAMKLNELKDDVCVSNIEEPIHEHKYTQYETKAATCTEDGEMTYECTCGYKYTEAIPALGHNFGKGIVTKPATCTEDGEMTYECTCGYKYTEAIPALDHNFGKWIVTKPATCTEDGEETRTCSRCKEEEKREIKKLGHTEGKWVIMEQPTLEKTGTKVLYCSVCGEEIRTEIIPKLHPIVKSISVPERLDITYKHSGKIVPKIVSDPGAKYIVTYSPYYANLKTVDVDGNGEVTGVRTGTALVTVTVTDDQGNVLKDTCKVTIRLNFWQVLIKIFLFGWIWY